MRLSFHQLQQFSGVFDNSGWPKRMGEYKNKVYMAQETGGKQYLKFLFLIQPFQRLPHKKSSHGGIIQSLSGLRRTGSDPFVITHSTTLILTTRQHLCHSFSAPSQRCCKFKAPRFHLSIYYHSLFRWDLSSTIQEIQSAPACLHVLVEVQMKLYRY